MHRNVFKARCPTKTTAECKQSGSSQLKEQTQTSNAYLTGPCAYVGTVKLLFMRQPPGQYDEPVRQPRHARQRDLHSPASLRLTSSISVQIRVSAHFSCSLPQFSALDPTLAPITIIIPSENSLNPPPFFGSWLLC